MRKEIAWNADEFGRALVPGVHDGRISTFTFADRDYLHLGIKTPQGNSIDVELSGIGEMNVRDLWNGAIVATIYAWKVRSMSRTSWDVPNSGWSLLFANRLAPSDIKEAAARIALSRPQSLLVQVECSYGGALAVVCDALSFFTDAAFTEKMSK